LPAVMMLILAVYWVSVFPAIAAGHWDGQIIRETSTRPAHTVFFLLWALAALV